jgi:hypothetical protein
MVAKKIPLLPRLEIYGITLCPLCTKPSILSIYKIWISFSVFDARHYF